ncbi:MAG: hypothetical protein SPE56_08055, partial [Prevotella sp.]|nr:hypothetical protein [Prevotella sp.]
AGHYTTTCNTHHPQDTNQLSRIHDESIPQNKIIHYGNLTLPIFWGRGKGEGACIARKAGGFL